MIETIVIDLDGTILDGQLRHYQCYSDILQAWNLQPVSIIEYWKMKRAGINRRDLLSYSGAESHYDRFLARWLALIEEKKYLLLDRLQDGAIKVLKDWKKKNIQIILVTMRQHQKNLNWQLDELNLSSLLDKVIRTGLGNSSDKADAIRKTLEKIDLDKIIWIGDTELDIQSAQLLGVKASAVCSGIRDEDYLKKYSPDYLAADLVSLASKIYV